MLPVSREWRWSGPLLRRHPVVLLAAEVLAVLGSEDTPGLGEGGVNEGGGCVHRGCWGASEGIQGDEMLVACVVW